MLIPLLSIYIDPFVLLSDPFVVPSIGSCVFMLLNYVVTTIEDFTPKYPCFTHQL
jgi:hypothetical protein